MLFRSGSAAEPVIREWFADETGMQVIAPPEDRRLIHFHHEHGCIGATLDGAVIKGGEPVIFEAKRVTWSQAGDWKDGAPRKHRVQAQHQMLATGLNACYIVGMINDSRLEIHLEERDDEFLNEIHLPECLAFWECVKTGIWKGEIDGSEGVKEAINLLYPDENNEIGRAHV